MVCPAARYTGLKLRSDVSERHKLDWHAVDPCRSDIAPLGLMIPSPLPTAVTVLLSAANIFRTECPVTSTPSYDKVSLFDPMVQPSVIVTRAVVPLPTAALHCIIVSDIQVLISHPVSPTPPLWLACCVTKLFTRIMIMVLFVGFRFEAYAPPIAGGLYESTSLKLITCLLTVNIIRRLDPTPCVLLQPVLVCDTQVVDSDAVRSARIDTEGPYTTSPTPKIVMESPPIKTMLFVPKLDTTTTSTDTMSDADPTNSPVVTVTRLELDSECAG